MKFCVVLKLYLRKMNTMESAPRLPEESESYKWTHAATLSFLELYDKYREQVGSLKLRNLKDLFEKIADDMRQICKLNVKAIHCENRWKVLYRNYKKFVDNSKQTGRGRKVFEYADAMHNILGQKKNINPVLLLDSVVQHITESVLSVEAEEETNETEKEHIIAPQPRRRMRVNNKNLRANMLREIREDRKNFYQKQLQVQESMLVEMRRKNDLKLERNALEKERNALEKERNDLIREKFKTSDIVQTLLD